MSEQIDIDINVNMNNVDEVDELTNKLQEASSEADNLSESLSNTEVPVMDWDELVTPVEDAETATEELQTQLDELGNTTVEPEVNVDSSSVDEVNDKLQETESSASSLTTALGGMAGVIGVDQMIGTADRINTSWNQLKLTFGGTSKTLEDLKLKTSQAADATGLSGSQVRGYFNSMGIAGIKNTELLSNSFQSLAGRSYQTGKSIDTMQMEMQKMVMSGNAGQMSLQRLGLTYDDLGQAMGVTADEAKDAFAALDQEGRLEAITKAMGDGKQANEMYKNSYAGLKQQAETAMAGLMGAVGQGVLPVITPMIQSATGFVKGFTGAFKGLPGPVQGVVGAIGGFLAVGTAAIGTLGLLGQVGSGVVGGLRSMKGAYDTVKGAMGTAKLMMDALRNSESITEGVRAALAIATGAEATAEGGAAAAKTAAIGPTTGLAIAENSLLWPILLVVGAIVAAIAVLWYLYNTNETVRNGINWLVAQIQAFINALMPIAQAIMNFVTQGVSHLDKLPSAVWNIFLRVLTFVTTWQVQLVQYGIKAAQSFISNVGSALSGIGGTISSALSGVYNAITAPFQQAYNFINDNVVKPLKDAWDWLSSAFSGFEGIDVEGYSGIDDTLNGAISNISNNSSSSNMTVNNNFNGIVEESAADYIVNAVNDRLKREKLLRGA